MTGYCPCTKPRPARSQPGFTILDPFSASLLGLFLFSEHIKAGVPDLAGEALALSTVIAGVTVLSHSHLIVGEDRPPAGQPDTRHTATVNGPGDCYLAAWRSGTMTRSRASFGHGGKRSVECQAGA